MNQLKIKIEYPSVRCEICHKSDLFDSISNYCIRCSDISIPNTPSESSIMTAVYQQECSLQNLIWQNENSTYIIGTVVAIIAIAAASFYLLPNASDIIPTDLVIEAANDTIGGEDSYIDSTFSCCRGMSTEEVINIFGLIMYANFLGIIFGTSKYISSHFKRSRIS